jgi:PIN domain nuclease of toxin-antitoxin system
MRLLIDTHTFLWFISDVSKIATSSLELMERPSSVVQISIASIWEISIKTAQKKLTVDGGFSSVKTDLVRNSIQILPISFEHTLANNQLPFHHKHPFDRMIAAQTIIEGIDLVSIDDIFDSYFAGTNVKRIW